MKDRIIYYIDGLNLYRGLKDAKLQYYYWLDLIKMVTNLNSENQTLEKVKYFTSIFSEKVNPCKTQWQKVYLKALGTFENLEIFKGRHQATTEQCKKCGNTYTKYSEKLTDVNIACEMFEDVYKKNCDAIGLVTADCDLKPVVEKIFNIFKNIKIFALFPPKRYSVELKQACTNCRVISRTLIKNCQLPDYILKKSGIKLYNPKKFVEHFREENRLRQ
ncbi:MAG: NYN domain-containing protein [Actinobacteria bacterium]|nr:NYN domain-containing protein [Actinomycetota bacterium]